MQIYKIYTYNAGTDNFVPGIDQQRTLTIHTKLINISIDVETLPISCREECTGEMI